MDEMSRTGKSIEAESRLVVSLGKGLWVCKRGKNANRFGVSPRGKVKISDGCITLIAVGFLDF